MNDEFIMFNDDNVDDNNSYQESYEPDDDITLEDVESYLESMRNDITDAIELRDDMIQEEYEYEDLSLEDVESYIESNIDVYNDTADSLNAIIQEADGSETIFIDPKLAEAVKRHKYNKQHGISDIKMDPNADAYLKQFSENKKRLKKELAPIIGDLIKKYPHKVVHLSDLKDTDEDEDEDEDRRPIEITESNNIAESYSLTDYRDNEIDLELDEPLTAYEFFDESYEPDDTPIVPRSNESIEYTQEVTVAELLGLTAAAIVLIKTGKALINRFTTNKKYGRFPKDMKRVYEIIESENFEASENKRALKKAFRALSKDLTYMLHGFGSRWKITVNEAEEIRKLKRHVDDLYTHGHMLTSNKQRSDKRRVGERIEGFLKQGNKVLEILNKSIYKNTTDDAVTEWMV